MMEYDGGSEYNEGGYDGDSTTTIQTGGKLYTEAGYGCIFIPPLRCKTNTGDRKDGVKDKRLMLDKLMKTEYAESEYAMTKEIRKIPNWKNYFGAADQICEPAPRPKQINRNLAKCDKIEDGENLSNFRILRMPYLGKALFQFQLTKKSDFKIVPFVKQLIAAGALLNLHGLVHFDIHQGNILVDEKYNVPRLIDFNLMVKATRADITDRDIPKGADYTLFQEPPDANLMADITTGRKDGGKSVTDYVRNIVKDKQILSIIQIIFSISATDMRADLEEFSLKSKVVQSKNFIAWFRQYWRLIDSWAIGCNIVLLIRSLLLWDGFNKNELEEARRFIFPVVKRMCAVSPFKRIDCVQALNMIDGDNFIIKKYGQKWLDRVGRV